jgi:hypothetical protein
VPGVLVLAWRSRTPASWWFLLTVLTQVALVNLKTYEARFYLFLLPALGAGMGLMFEKIHRLFRRKGASEALLLAGLVLVAFVTFKTVTKSNWRLHTQDEELRAAVSGARPFVTSATRVVARKPHLAYYTDAKWVYLKERKLDQLREEWSTATGDDGETLLYVGSFERRKRKSLARLVNPSSTPPWLAPFASGDEAGGWALFRVAVAGSGTSTPDPPTSP